MPGRVEKNSDLGLTNAKIETHVLHFRSQALTPDDEKVEADNAAAYLEAIRGLYDRRLATGERVRTRARQALTAVSAFFAFVQVTSVNVVKTTIDGHHGHAAAIDQIVWAAALGGATLGALAVITLFGIDSLPRSGRIAPEDFKRALYAINRDGSLDQPAAPRPLSTADVRLGFADVLLPTINDLARSASKRREWEVVGHLLTALVIGISIFELTATFVLLQALR